MSTTTNLSTLKINYLTQAQYDAALANSQINENEIYLTPSLAVDSTHSFTTGITGSIGYDDNGYTTHIMGTNSSGTDPVYGKVGASPNGVSLAYVDENAIEFNTGINVVAGNINFYGSKIVVILDDTVDTELIGAIEDVGWDTDVFETSSSV